MRSALSLPVPKPSAAPDPQGPVQPLDIEIEDGEEIPLGGDGTSLRVEGDGLILSQDGLPVEIRLDGTGIRVEPTEPPD